MHNLYWPLYGKMALDLLDNTQQYLKSEHKLWIEINKGTSNSKKASSALAEMNEFDKIRNTIIEEYLVRLSFIRKTF